MVWKSALRQHSRGTFSDALSSHSRQVVVSSPAELQVREIASKIGLQEDSEVLATVCNKMRKEFVVEEWQLPALDSRQWEKMHAPIGLAVAVKHISSYRLREQLNRRSLLEQEQEQELEQNLNNNSQVHNETKPEQRNLHVIEKEEDPLAFSSPHKTIATTIPSLDGPSKEEKVRDGIEFQAENSGGNDPVQARTTFIDTSTTINTDGKINDEPHKIKNVVTANDNKKSCDANHPIMASDDIEKDHAFSEDCDDWLKLTKVEMPNEDQEELTKEECNKVEDETTTPVSKIDNNFNDSNNVTDSTARQASPAPAMAVAQTSTESLDEIAKLAPSSVEKEPVDSLELETSMPSALVETKQEDIQDGIEPTDGIEREIPTTIEKNTESAQVNNEPSNILTEVKREQGTSEADIKPIDSESATTPKQVEQKETPNAEIHSGKERESLTAELVIDPNTAQGEEIPDAYSSDSESDDNTNTNIFSDIGNSVSFSEDEDYQIPANKETAKLDCLLDPLDNSEEFARLSSSDPGTNRLLYPDNGSDDITVHVSNVSPECKMSAAKKIKTIYRHEYDRDTSSFQIETSTLQDILAQLPDDDHRSILSQLMIMTNARDRNLRINIAFQIQDSLVDLIAKNNMDVEPAKAVQLIFHLSRLKKSYRIIFGKSVFKAMSKLYKRSEKLNKKNSYRKNEDKSRQKSSPKKEEKKLKRKNSLRKNEEKVKQKDSPSKKEENSSIADLEIPTIENQEVSQQKEITR